MSDQKIEHCPTCRSAVTLEGTVTRYYMPVDDPRISDLERQLAEREAALASAVGVLQKVVNPSYSHPTIPNATTRYMRREIIAMASDVLSSLPATAKANAKIIEAAEEQAWAFANSPNMDTYLTFAYRTDTAVREKKEMIDENP